MNESRIALIHATPLAMEPVRKAFKQLWPEAVRMDLLDDSLSPDLSAAGWIDEALTERFIALARYAVQSGAVGILFTCSAFGPAIEAAGASAGVPTLKPNEAMFEEALDVCAGLGRPGRIGMISTFAASVASMRHELEAIAGKRGIDFTLHVECPAGALEALSQGRPADHDAQVLAAARELRGCDIVMLGQFSTAHMRERVAADLSVPVLSSPDSAVRSLKKSVEST
ncbi:MAG: aspartate/glutamate racemase family protein [Xylophilus ampelinus]